MGWPRALFSGLLSLVVPGLGQVHAEAWRLGALWLVFGAAFSVAIRLLTWLSPTPARVLVLCTLVAVSLLALNGFSAVHAVLRARRTPRSAPGAWFRSTWFTALVVLAVQVSIASALPPHWQAFSNPSESNVPTLLVGDYVFVDLNRAGLLPSRGDMIVFHLPHDPSIDYVKRVVGLPGDRVQMKKGQLFLNGQQVVRVATGELVIDNRSNATLYQVYREMLSTEHQYSITKLGGDMPHDNTQEFVTPPSNVFTLGDNRDNSADSRSLHEVGFIPLDHIIGPAKVIYWSNDWGRIGSVVN